MTKTKRRVYSRKGECAICHVSTGSMHNKLCVYAYNTEQDSKSIYNEQKDYRIMIKNEVIKSKSLNNIILPYPTKIIKTTHITPKTSTSQLSNFFAHFTIDRFLLNTKLSRKNTAKHTKHINAKKLAGIK